MKVLFAFGCALALLGCTEADPCFAPPYAPGCPGATEQEMSENKPDLIGWYRFEGEPDVGAIDSSANGFDAACSQRCPQRTEGVDGQALLADGESFLTVSTEGEFSNDALTISAWIRDDHAPGDTSMGMVVGKPYLAGMDNSYRMHTRDYDDDGRRDLVFRVGGDLGPDQALTRDFDDFRGVWTHVAGTWDGENMTLYVDGEFAASVPASVIEYDDQPLVIGADLNSFESDNHWEGGIDEVRIYRRALAPGEIAELSSR